MNVSMRDLKAHLSDYVRKARDGQNVVIRIHNKPVARITSIKEPVSLETLKNMPGILWNGGKPAGLPKGERIRGKTLAEMVIEDRR